ncbi:urease isoform X1, partial [Tanacetum coccineum]
VGGCHAPDIIKVCGVKNILPSSTNPTRPSVDDIFILMTYSKFWGDEYCCWETQKMRIASVKVVFTILIPLMHVQMVVQIPLIEFNVCVSAGMASTDANNRQHQLALQLDTDVTLMSNAQPNSRPDSGRHAQEISPSEATEMLVQPHGSSNALLLAALPHTIQGFPVSCSSQHSEHLSNFCGFQLQSQCGQSVLPYLHYGDTRNVSSADLRAWGARAPYTSLKDRALGSGFIRTRKNARIRAVEILIHVCRRSRLLVLYQSMMRLLPMWDQPKLKLKVCLLRMISEDVKGRLTNV